MAGNSRYLKRYRSFRLSAAAAYLFALIRKPEIPADGCSNLDSCPMSFFLCAHASVPFNVSPRLRIVD